MPEQPVEITKLVAVATSMDYPANLRMEAVDTIGRMGTHEALLALLQIAGNQDLMRHEREQALKYATKIVKSSR